MRIPIMNLDQVGIIADQVPYDLPLNAWSRGKNVRFSEGKAEKVKGYETLITPGVPPYFLLPVDSPMGYFWIYAGNQKVRVVQDQAHVDITRVAGDYTAPVGNRWTGGLLNGIPVLNNGTDKPQVWTNPSPATALVDLPNWPSTWTCNSLRPYKFYLVAIGITQNGVLNPHRIAWSHIADPGTIPNSWDITDPTKDAADLYVADTDGVLLDQCQLGDFNILYKSDSAYLMRHIGGVDIMAVKRISSSDGILAQNCVTEINHGGMNKHVVLGQGDVYLTNGTSVEPFLRGRLRNWLFRNLDSVNYRNSFVAHNVDTKEVYICFPETGKTWPNLAIVWNYLSDTTAIKEIPSVSCASVGRAVPDFREVAVDSWANATGTWADDNATWGATEYSPVSKRLIMGSAVDTKIYFQDQKSSFNGQAVTSVLERLGLNVLGKAADGTPIFDSDSVKTVTELWPRISAAKGVTFNIYLGAQDTQDANIRWKGPYPFVVGRDKKINPYITGKIISVRFEVTTKETWSLSGYDLEIIPGGKY